MTTSSTSHSSATAPQAHSAASSYFDLHTTGLGYLNRIREVTPKKGDPFLACDIAALHGAMDAPEYCRFDVRVSGTEAQHLVRRCEEAVKAERKVLIGFRLGDLWAEVFRHTKGKYAGHPGVSLKGRLLMIHWIKVDGKQVYKAEPRSTGQEFDETNASTDTPPAVPSSEAPSESEAIRAEAVESF